MFFMNNRTSSSYLVMSDTNIQMERFKVFTQIVTKGHCLTFSRFHICFVASYGSILFDKVNDNFL